MKAPLLRKFARGDRVYIKAQQVWVILVAHVMTTKGPWRNRLMTYGDLAEIMGLDRRAGIGLGRELGIVGHYCIKNHLPGLNCVVIGEETNAPGPGVVHRASNWKEDARDVMKIDWFQFRVPTTGTFRQVWEGSV